MKTTTSKILAIDDTPENLLTLGAVLATEFDLQVATSGTMGLALAEKSVPDLILLDVMMPGMDGFEVCRRIKANPRLNLVPVIFITALTDRDAEVFGLTLGAADFITKPINIDIARQRIRTLLERESLRKEISRQRDALDEAQRIARMGSWALDLSTDQLTWSAGIFRLFEIDPLQFNATYQGFLAAIHPEDRAAVDHAYLNALTTQQRYEMTHRLLMPDGRIKWVHQCGETTFDAAGKAVRSIGTVRDISERKMAEAAIVQSEQRIRNMSDAAGAYLWEVDLNMVYTYVSGQSRKVKGRLPEELLGQTPMLFMPAEDVARVGDIVSRAIAEQSPFRLQHRDVTPSGEILWEEVYGAVFCDASGKVIGLRGTGMDINARKQAEAELRIAATAFESQEGMYITDVDHEILRVNQAFSRITGYRAEEAVGQTPTLFNSERHPPEFYAAMDQCLRDSGAWEGEIWRRRKNGEIYPEWLTIAAVKDERGQVVNFVATLTDITARKQAEDEIRQLAFYDPLTRLPNRRLMADRLRHALVVTGRNGRQGALILLDLDNFKRLNDTHGHDAGDQLLVEVARRLTACVRERDTVARLGGDEFVVILEEFENGPAAAQQAENVAEKIRSSLSQPYVVEVNEMVAGNSVRVPREHHCAASIGIALFDQQAVTPETLLKRADIAMYAAKAAGRNAVRFFDADARAVQVTP